MEEARACAVAAGVARAAPAIAAGVDSDDSGELLALPPPVTEGLPCSRL